MGQNKRNNEIPSVGLLIYLFVRGGRSVSQLRLIIAITVILFVIEQHYWIVGDV